MGLEVALLESDPDRGVRILGRTTDATLVASVRGHLIERLNQPPESQQEPAALRLVSRLDPDGGLDRDPETQSSAVVRVPKKDARVEGVEDE
jgi:hypothetical protein